MATNDQGPWRRLSYTAAFKLKVVAFAKKTNNCAAQQNFSISKKRFMSWINTLMVLVSMTMIHLKAKSVVIENHEPWNWWIHWVYLMGRKKIVVRCIGPRLFSAFLRSTKRSWWVPEYHRKNEETREQQNGTNWQHGRDTHEFWHASFTYSEHLRQEVSSYKNHRHDKNHFTVVLACLAWNKVE